jgi:hypothetical protein
MRPPVKSRIGSEALEEEEKGSYRMAIAEVSGLHFTLIFLIKEPDGSH